MSTTVIGDSMMRPVTESPPVATKLITDTTEVVSANCDCCVLTEECTPEYIERIRERYHVKWICGLCGEAVKDEIVRNKRFISTEEAMARHVSFCRTSISSALPRDLSARLIAAVRRILRRSLESPTAVRSLPCTPTSKISDSTIITRSESCIPKLTLVESEEDDERSNQVNYSQQITNLVKCAFKVVVIEK